MKSIQVLIVSALACTHRATAIRLFALTKPSTNDALASVKRPSPVAADAAIFDVPRGGDLGPLTTDVAAKSLLAFTLLNGWTCWLATDGTLKSWATGTEASDKVKLLFSGMGQHMFIQSVAGLALMNGASAETTLALTNLIWTGWLMNWFIDGIPTKFGIDKTGLYINFAITSLVAYANLLHKDWASTINKVLAVWTGLNALVGAVLPAKFKEGWNFGDNDGGAIGDLGVNNFIWLIVGNAVLLCSLVFMKEDAAKVIGYTNIPLLILSIYNAHLSKAANELIEPLPRIVFAAVLAVLVAATLL